MMVTASPADEPIGGEGGRGGGEMSIAPLLATLDSKGVVLEDRVDAYLTLTERLRGDDQQNLAQEISQHTSQLTRLFCVDIMNESSELSQAALQALGFCVYHQDISRSISEEDANTVLKALCNSLLKTEDKSTCTRALWCMSKQNFTSKAIKSELHSILCAVEHALVKSQFKSMTVEHESVNVIIKLLEQVPEEMPSYASRWAKLIYPLLVHSAHKIRERSAFAMQQALPALQAHRAEIIPNLIPDLKAALVPEMVKLFAGRQELHVLRIWGYFVSILGKSLHKGGSLINCLLGVVEQGFKHPSAQVKKASFGVWNILIDNFATEPEILYNAKRLKVLMQPLKATSAKSESVAHAKLDTWWHLCQRLGPRLASNFDLVCVPLLEASLGVKSSPDYLLSPNTPSAGNTWPNKQLFGTPKTPQHRKGPVSMASPATPRLNLPPGTPGSKNPVFKSVQSRGVEMLVRLLGQPDLDGDCSIKMCNIATAALDHKLISSPTIFIKIARVLMTVVKEVIVLGCQQNIGNNTSEDLLLQIWVCLVAHVKNMVEVASKRDSVDIFNDFMRCIECLIAAWPSVEAKMILKLLEIVGRHIPVKILGSPSYHSSCAGAMHGTPALNLIRMLFGPHKIDAMVNERYFIVYDKLIEAGMSTPNTILGFAQSVVELIADDEILSAGGSEIGWRLWNRLANPLLEHVIQSNEVNQGDSLDHDFSAMYACLLFPPVKLLNNDVSEGTLKTLVKTWSELYQAFVRCSALVTTTEPNECCEELATKILEETKKQSSKGTANHKNARWLEAALHMCQVMVDSIDFSAFASKHGNEQLTPSKWTKKKVRPLGNVHSLALLLVGYMDDINNTLQKRDAELKTFHQAFKRNAKEFHMTLAMSYAIGAVNHIFTHVSQPGIISSLLAKLAQPLANFYKRLAHRIGTQTHIYSESTQQKLEKLWIDILTSIQTRYGGPYDNYFLSTMTPLLETTFLHPRRAIKDHTLVFWNATFATANGSFEYQASFKKVLSQLKEKTTITLPGWSQSDNVDMVNETPMSQLIESEASQSIMGPPSAVIPNFGSPSPVKMHGSFLKRSVQAGRLVASSSPDRMRGRSPGRFSSPERGRSKSPGHNTPTSKRNQSPNVAAARRKLPVDEDSMQFVAIAPSPTKKRVLTEHQKEVLRQRRTVIPGLYNDLEQSQDTQTFNAMFSQTQTQIEADPELSNEHESPIDQIVENHTTPTKLDATTESHITPTKADDATESPLKASGEPEDTPTKTTETRAESPKSNAASSSQDTVVTNVDSPSNISTSNAPSVFSRKGFSETEPCGIVKIWTRGELRPGPAKSSPGPKASISSKILSAKTDQTDDMEHNGEEKDRSEIELDECDDDNEVQATEQPQEDVDTKPKDDNVQNIPDENQEMAAAENPDLLTPTKNSSSEVNQLLPDETTPPKTSQPPNSNVMVTPVIKLQKMSVQDILRYSPRAVDSSAFAKLDVDSSPKMFPSSQKKDEEQRRTRFRRYKSEEIQSSPRSTRSQGRSFDDMVILETQSEDIESNKSLAGKQQGLVTSQADIAELAEHFELDGIEPLKDDVVDNTNDKPNDNGDKNTSTSERENTCADEVQTSQAKDSKSELTRESSEESMEFIDTQEELIPEASFDEATELESEVAMETDSQSDYFTPDEAESSKSCESENDNDKSADAKNVEECDQKSKEKPEFVMSTLEELTEPESQSQPSELSSKPDAEKTAFNTDERQSDTKKDEHKKPKRGRGRPRKVVDESSASDSMSEDTSSQLEQRARRGRSRKVAEQTESLSGKTSDQSEKKRGCKKGNENLADDNMSDSSVKSKGRGRRRKVQTDNADDSESLSEGSQEKKHVESASSDEVESEPNKDSQYNEPKSDCNDTNNKENPKESEEIQSVQENGGKTKESSQSKNMDGDDTAAQNDTNEAVETPENVTVEQAIDGNQNKNSPEADSQANGSHLENSCEDMFGTYNADIPSQNMSDNLEKEEDSGSGEEHKSSNIRRKTRSTTDSVVPTDEEEQNSVVVLEENTSSNKRKTRQANKNLEKVADAQNDEGSNAVVEEKASSNRRKTRLTEKILESIPSKDEEESSIAMVDEKPASNKRKRIFTKLSRKRRHSPSVWDDDDDLPLAKITHSYLDVESQSSEDSDDEPLIVKTSMATRSKSLSAKELPSSEQTVANASQKEMPADTKRHKRKSSRFPSIKKSPQSVIAKKVLKRAMKSPQEKSAKLLSPVRRRSSTPVFDKKRSPIATRLRAGKLTPTSARRLLAGHGRRSPMKVVKKEKKIEAEDDLNISGVEEHDSSFDDSFDMPLNEYVKQNKSTVDTAKDRLGSSVQHSDKENTTQESKTVNESNVSTEEQQCQTQESKTVNESNVNTEEQCQSKKSSVEEIVNSIQIPAEPIVKEVQILDPKVGQSLQSLPQRLQFVALSGRESPTECNTPPKNTSPVVPHKFSPRSSSSPVEFAMRRGGSPKHRASPVACEIPGVFSPSASPTNGILKRRDSKSPSPSPSTKSRRVSFAEPVEQKQTTEPSSPQAKPCIITSAVSGSTIAALMPSPLVTTTSSRVVSLQSKFITTPSRRANSTSKLKSVASVERSQQRQAKKQSLKVMNTRMLFSRGARALMASKNGLTEVGGKKVSIQEQLEMAAVTLSPSSSISPTPSTQGTQGVLTQGTQNADSSMEVDFESQEAVFPDLVDCDVPVDKVLHQLTSSMWVRGLEQLIRARNILTVGHLCSLSPGQVKSLPIRSPKVSTLCQVMERFKKRQLAKLEKENASTTVLKKLNPSQTTSGDTRDNAIVKAQLSNDSATKESPLLTTQTKVSSSQEETGSKVPASNMDSVPTDKVTAAEVDSSKTELDSTKEEQGAISESQPFYVTDSAETRSSEGFRIMSPKYKPPVSKCAANNVEQGDTNESSVKTIPDKSINNNNTTTFRRGKRKRSDEEENPESDSASTSCQSSPKRQRMVQQLGDIAKEFSGETLQNLSTEKLFQAHQHVNNLMESIMAALKTKCRSPSLES